MIDTTTISPRNILTGVIVAALLLISAVALLALVGDSASETASGSRHKVRTGHNRRKGRDNRYRQRHPDRKGSGAHGH